MLHWPAESFTFISAKGLNSLNLNSENQCAKFYASSHLLHLLLIFLYTNRSNLTITTWPSMITSMQHAYDQQPRPNSFPENVAEILQNRRVHS